jgi:hypothetical protein
MHRNKFLFVLLCLGFLAPARAELTKCSVSNSPTKGALDYIAQDLEEGIKKAEVRTGKVS